MQKRKKKKSGFNTSHKRAHTQKSRYRKIHLCPVQNMRNLYALIPQMRVQQVSDIERRRTSYRWPLEQKMKTSRLLGSRLFFVSVQYKKTCDTLTCCRAAGHLLFCLFACLLACFECKFIRPMLEQQSIVLSSAVSWLLYCVWTLGFLGEERLRRALSWTVVMWWHWCLRYSPVLL